MASMSACFLAVSPKSICLSLPQKPLFSPSQLHYFTPLPSVILAQPPRFWCGRTSISVIRASSSSVDDGSMSMAISPGGSVESDKLPSGVRKRAMDAIDSSGRRVTIGDVASKAGLKLNEAQKALQALAADTNGFLEMAAEYLVRVSFGTALIASIVLVYTTIIAIASSSRYWDPYYYRRRRVREGDGGMNFIESIGEYITSNGGVVTAEELAPFLDLETTEDMDDDSYILPVLLRFDGQAEVDDEVRSLQLDVYLSLCCLFGEYFIPFPSLQRTAAPQRSGRKEYIGKRWTDWVGDVDKFFKEKTWQFRDTTVSSSGFITFVSDIFPLLQIYAGSFFAIPLIRWFFVQNKNAKIVKRNRAREQRARALESPDLSLRRKKTFIGNDRIVYSTERDLFEQDYETREWDRRFKEIEKSE
ncbi:putative protein, chloroplastic [Sesamum angolense]|uniref:Uncharacterized protein n=1 Tax=Sesamum angolense TaxID=2727404 RepID=A0AAE1WNT2_9LAMI|nr:putative protein, chloroplastic [Sesamum angolense]